MDAIKSNHKIEQQGKIEVKTFVEADQVMIEVEDNGIGTKFTIGIPRTDR